MMRFQFRFYTFCGLLVFLIACSPEPRPIRYGEDACYACKMTLAEKKFGGELVTRKGKVYVFDDINCLLSLYNKPGADELAFSLVINYEKPGELIKAGETFFVRSDSLRSPMGGNIAAFGSYANAMKFKQKLGGILLGWAEVTTQYK